MNNALHLAIAIANLPLLLLCWRVAFWVDDRNKPFGSKTMPRFAFIPVILGSTYWVFALAWFFVFCAFLLTFGSFALYQYYKDKGGLGGKIIKYLSEKV